MKVRFRLVLLIPLLVLASCTDKPAKFTYEQAVLESVFIKLIGDSVTKFYLASRTDNEWFLETNVQDVISRIEKENHKYIDKKILVKLFELNKDQESVNWSPIMTTVSLLPDQYSDRNGGMTNDERCLVDKADVNISIWDSRSDKGFRSYYTVSKVAINTERKIAMVKVGYYCAPLSGGNETLYLLVFEKNQWIVKDGLLLWIS